MDVDGFWTYTVTTKYRWLLWVHFKLLVYCSSTRQRQKAWWPDFIAPKRNSRHPYARRVLCTPGRVESGRMLPRKNNHINIHGTNPDVPVPCSAATAEWRNIAVLGRVRQRAWGGVGHIVNCQMTVSPTMSLMGACVIRHVSSWCPSH